ncbi:MAG: 50S ribosomal protein L29 [Chloroflexota bacterium]|nr:50S ribosomal protein L29 [Chloroflexota bacterium]
MKPADVRALDDDRLDRRIEELLGEWRTLRFQEAVGQLTATSRIRQIRKDIARIKTVQTEREIELELEALVQNRTNPDRQIAEVSS